MRARDFFAVEADDLGFLWKYQLLLGFVLILIGAGVVLLPGLLDLMVAIGIVLVGVSVTGSAVRFRRVHKRHRQLSLNDTFEW